jgi:hypothetical protein
VVQSVVEIKTGENGKETDGKRVSFGAPATVGRINLYEGEVQGISLRQWEIKAESEELTKQSIGVIASSTSI